MSRPHRRRLSWRHSLLIALLFAPAASADSAAGDALSPSPHPRASHRTGLALAGLYAQVRDDLVCPLRWSGIGAALEFSRDRLDESSRRQVSLKLPLGLLNNRYGHRAGAPGLQLGYARLRRVSWFAGSGATFAGVALRGHMDLQYYVDWDEEHLYWFTAYDLAAAAQQEIQLRPRQRLELRIALPPIALVSRPPRRRYYKVDDFMHLGFWFREPNGGLHLATWPQYLAGAFSAQYLHSLGDSWRLGAGYEFSYRRYSRPEPVRLLTHYLSLRVTHGA